MIQEWFPDDTDGELWKIEDWFEFPDNGFDFTSNNDADLQRRTILQNGQQTLYPAPYRFMYRKRSLGPGDSANNYTNIFKMIDAASPTPAYSPSGASVSAPVPRNQFNRSSTTNSGCAFSPPAHLRQPGQLWLQIGQERLRLHRKWIDLQPVDWTRLHDGRGRRRLSQGLTGSPTRG
jgi:hypothetical protein